MNCLLQYNIFLTIASQVIIFICGAIQKQSNMKFLEKMESHYKFRDNCCPDVNYGHEYYSLKHLALELGMEKEDLIDLLVKVNFCETNGSPTKQSMDNCYFIPGQVMISDGMRGEYWVTEQGRSYVRSILP